MTKNSLQSYKLLAKALMLPIPWIRWILIVGVCLVVIAWPVTRVFDNPICAILGGGLIVLYVVFLCAMMPVQALSIASSKQFSLLANLRQKILAILMVPTLGGGFLASVYALFTAQPLSTLHALLAISWLISWVILGSIYAISCWPGAQYFVFGGVWRFLDWRTIFFNIGQSNDSCMSGVAKLNVAGFFILVVAMEANKIL